MKSTFSVGPWNTGAKTDRLGYYFVYGEDSFFSESTEVFSVD
jgi:hypothetical protein